MPRKFYQSNIESLSSLINKTEKNISKMYLLRLTTFIMFVGFLVCTFIFDYQILCATLSFVGFGTFTYAVRHDLKLVRQLAYLKNKLILNEDELLYLDFQFSHKHNGELYSNLNPHLAADFDLFGNGSLFQYINRCSTTGGEQLFAQGMANPSRNLNEIIKKQEAIIELSKKLELLQEFQAKGKELNENGDEIQNLLNWFEEEPLKLSTLKIFMIVVPILNISWFILIAIGLVPPNLFILPLLIGLSGAGRFNRKINKTHQKLGRMSKAFEQYSELISLIEKSDFQSEHMVLIQKNYKSNTNKASTEIHTLFKLLNAFDLRLNIILAVAFNALFVFDLHVYSRLERWKLKNNSNIKKWFTALHTFDSLVGYAVFSHNNHKNVSYPKVQEGEFGIDAEDMGHPLLHLNARINNSFKHFGNPSATIVTGANMAGKSTFLRTIATNLILGMNGAPVCAKNFSFTPCYIFSSIKIQDSLSNNESYFYAELLRIKEIIQHAKAHKNTLVILDEILRGTNSKDKQLGSIGLLEKLIAMNSSVIIATHDLTLGDLEEKYPKVVQNHCFEVELFDDQLSFDYKLKQGISQKLNASFLMKKMEII